MVSQVNLKNMMRLKGTTEVYNIVVVNAGIIWFLLGALA